MKELELEDDLLSKIPVRYVLIVKGLHFILINSFPGICVPNYTRSHLNSSDNKGYSAFCKARGL